jgi:hypothetical protein
MIDLSKLEYHTASRDAQGKPVLLPKPRPPEYDKANAISRLTYAHAATREAEAVMAAAREAAIPDKPANWAQGSAIDHLTWHFEAKRG